MTTRTTFDSLIRSATPIAFAACLAALAGCGGGGATEAPIDPPGPTSDPTVEETLAMLGIDTSQTPRFDHRGDPLPDSYSPLGLTHDLGRISELCAIGLRGYSMGPFDPDDVFWMVEDGRDAQQAPGQVPWGAAHALDAESAPWAQDPRQVGLPPTSRRAAASSDLDGDGREEVAIVHFDDEGLHLVILADKDGGFAPSETLLLEGPTTIADVVLAAGDVDGDLRDELVIGYSLNSGAVLRVIDMSEAGFALVPGLSRNFPPEFFFSVVLLDLELGNLDYDGPEEIALVANEYTSDGTFREARSSRWYVLDDADSMLAELESGRLEAVDGDGVLRTALVADVGVGDIDADGLEEVVLAGLWAPDAWTGGLASYVLRANEDLAHDFELISSAVVEHSIGDVKLGWAAVGMVDLEGDRAHEIYVNNVVFADFQHASPWTVRGSMEDWWTGKTFLDTTTMAVTSGDFTGDGREDVAFVVQDWDAIFYVWGIPVDGEDQELQHLHALQFLDNSGPALNPILLDTNPDSDTTVLALDVGPLGIVEFGHRLIFTEPIVMAALAAAPCTLNIGQNIDACTTEFGESNTSGEGGTFQVGGSASFVTGAEVKVFGVGAETELKLGAEYNFTYSNSYGTTSSLSYATGPLEDTVICSVIPYDQYLYRVISDPDPMHVDEVVYLGVPRSQIVVQMERGFYNSIIPASGTRIDETVFVHEVGDARSYRSESDAVAISNLTPVLFSKIATVGVGAGAVTAAIDVWVEESWDHYIGFIAEFQLNGTAGAKLGFNVSFNIGGSFAWTVGTETTYSGTVGAIDPAHYAAEFYSFKLFSYMHQDPDTGMAFQVLDYWVE